MSTENKKHGPIIDFLLKNHLADNVTTANAMLIGIFLLNMIITLSIAETTWGYSFLNEGVNLENSPMDVVDHSSF